MLRGLDLEDFKSEIPTLEISHRAPTGTPLEVVSDCIQMNHLKVRDDNDRMPLIGTSKGRSHTTTIRDQIYRITRHCHYLNECPHDRDREECEGAKSRLASK